MSDFAEGYAVGQSNGAYTDGFGGGGGWVWIIVLFAIFGFGGWGNNRNQDAVTESGLCNAMGFNDLANAVGRLSDQNQNQTMTLGNGICNLGYEMQGSIGQLGKDVALSQAELSRQISDCCCGTQRAIDAAKYDQSLGFAAINANIDAKFAALEKAGLERQIADQAAKINQLELAQQMYGVVRYPNGYTYNAGASPFCGYGQCGGAAIQ